MGGGTVISTMDSQPSMTTAQGRPLGPGAQNISTCLAYNQAYQEILDTFITRVECGYQLVKEREREVEKSLSLASEGGMAKKQAKVPVLMYLPPYFRDTHGMCPPKNADTLKKEEMGEFDALDAPSKPWSKTEMDTLRYAAQDVAVAKHTEGLRLRRELLMEKLEPLKTNKTLSATVKEEIDQLDEELARERATFKAGREHTDMIDWFEIAKMNLKSTRTPTECKLKWMNELAPDFTDSTVEWTDAEKRMLSDLVAEERQMGRSKPNWDNVAEALQTGRSPWQCFVKYQQELNVEMHKREWTKEECTMLETLVNQLKQGSHIPWEQITFYMDGRTRTQCRTQWTRLNNPTKRLGNWNEEEDVLLLIGVQKFGAKDWAKVSAVVPGRNEQQCRERYTIGLELQAESPRLKYTPEEDTRLIQLVLEVGQDWYTIARHMKNRSVASLKTRWRSLSKMTAGETARKEIQLESPLLKLSYSHNNEMVKGVSEAARTRKRTYQPHIDEKDNQDKVDEIQAKKSRSLRLTHLEKIEERKRRVFTQFQTVVNGAMDGDDDSDNPVMHAIGKVAHSDMSDMSDTSEMADPSFMMASTSQSSSNRQRVGHRRRLRRRKRADMVPNPKAVDDALDSTQLTPDVRQIVKRYRQEILATARVQRAKKQEQASAYRSYMDDKNIDSVETAVINTDNSEPPDTGVYQRLAEVLFKADRVVSNEASSVATLDEKKRASSKAYEHAMMVPKDMPEPSLSLLPPALATMKAYKQINTFICSVNNCQKRKRIQSKSGDHQPSSATVKLVEGTRAHKEFKARMSAMFTWPAAISDLHCYHGMPPPVRPASSANLTKVKKTVQIDESQNTTQPVNSSGNDSKV